MESARRGASGMDAARGVKGHGWPLYAGPRSGDGMREVERSETRMQGQDLLVPFGATAKRDSPSRAKQCLSLLANRDTRPSRKASQATSLRDRRDVVQTIRRRRRPFSGGRMESLRRGASGMDGLGAVTGRGPRHGWPLQGDPRSSDGMRKVDRSEPGAPSPDAGTGFLVLFGRSWPSGNGQKVTRPAARNQRLGQLRK
jgi:hypothetical protein